MLNRIEVIVGIFVPVITSLVTIYSVIKAQNNRTSEKELADKERDARIEEQLKTLFNTIKRLEEKQDENNHVKIRTAELEIWKIQHEKQTDLWQKQTDLWQKQIENRITHLESGK